jgi:hypothetical protein
MDLEVASSEQVIEWFEARPDYQEMLIQDMRKKLGLHLLKEFKFVFDHTEFWIHPIVGIIPDYSLIELEFQFGEVQNNPDWESRGDFEDFGRRIYKRLWFIIWVKINDGEIESGFDHLTNYEDIKKRFIDEDEVLFKNFEDYYYGWIDRVFSNGRRFFPINELPDLAAADFVDSEEITHSRSPGGDIEMSASVINADDGRIFVRVHFDFYYLMEVASNEEAETILNEIWG